MKQGLLNLTIFATLAFFATTPVFAASGSWSVGSGGDWAASGNWASGIIPGLAGSTSGANTDVATFGGSTSSTVAGTTYTITDTTTSTRALGGFNFGSKGNFVIGGSSSSTLYFSDYATNGGIAGVNEASTSSNVSHTIASNIVTAGSAAAGSSNFRIGTLSGFTGTLTLSGNITTNATATGSNVNNIRVVTSGAVNGSSNLSNIVLLSGIISDGANAKINVSHARDGVLELSGADTYSGGFIQGAGDGTNTITRIGISSVGSATASNLASGAFGTGTLTLNSGEISSMSTTAYTIGNAVTFTGTGAGSSPIILGDSNASYNGALTFTGPVGLTGSATITLTTNSNVTMSGVVSGSSAALTKLGTGALTLSGANSYSGGTTISSGTLYVNNTGGASYTAPITNPHATITATNSTGSGTGTGAVTVKSGGTLAGSGTIATSSGVTVQAGGALSSGGIQAGTSAGQGLTLNNTALTVNGGATLTFALGSTTAYNGGSGALNFANPNTDSTYLSLTGSTVDQIFANTTLSINIHLIDLTTGSNTVSLTLRAQNPYLLIQTGLGTNADFANLMTTGGLGHNGYVTGVSNGQGGYTSFNLGAYDINGNLISSSTNLENLQLFLYNGDLEVVPEPGTWSLMLGGLFLLIGVQRLRRNRL